MSTMTPQRTDRDWCARVAVDSIGWGYLPGHAPIYVGLDGGQS